MTNLTNAVQGSIVATNQPMERMEKHVENGNDGGPITLATFLKVNPPVFNGSTSPTESNN
ncbi:hypothetical protein AHAS_Ahas18G0165000 [Arachis hypogaea]